MNSRPAHTTIEIDFLPPFGQPAVTTTGNGAVDVALFATAIAAGIAVFVGE